MGGVNPLFLSATPREVAHLYSLHHGLACARLLQSAHTDLHANYAATQLAPSHLAEHATAPAIRRAHPYLHDLGDGVSRAVGLISGGA